MSGETDLLWRIKGFIGRPDKMGLPGNVGAGNMGVGGIPVFLMDRQKAIIATAMSESEGKRAGRYHFDDLPLGEYYLLFMREHFIEGDAQELLGLITPAEVRIELGSREAVPVELRSREAVPVELEDREQEAPPAYYFLSQAERLAGRIIKSLERLTTALKEIKPPDLTAFADRLEGELPSPRKALAIAMHDPRAVRVEGEDLEPLTKAITKTQERWREINYRLRDIGKISYLPNEFGEQVRELLELAVTEDQWLKRQQASLDEKPLAVDLFEAIRAQLRDETWRQRGHLVGALEGLKEAAAARAEAERDYGASDGVDWDALAEKFSKVKDTVLKLDIKIDGPGAGGQFGEPAPRLSRAAD